MRFRSILSPVSSLFKNLLISYLTTFLLLLLFSFLMLKTKPSLSMVSIGILVIYFLSCFLGGFLIGKQKKERKFLWGFCVGSSYFLLLVLLSLLFHHALQGDASNFATTALLCLGSGTLGGMLS